jgi:hypothetical protein
MRGAHCPALSSAPARTHAGADPFRVPAKPRWQIRARSRTCLFRLEHKSGEMIRSAEVPMEKQGNQIVETAMEARGGLLGRPILSVLVVSCALAVAVMVLTYVGVVKF